MELYFQQKSEEVVKKYFLGFIKILLIVAGSFLV